MQTFFIIIGAQKSKMEAMQAITVMFLSIITLLYLIKRYPDMIVHRLFFQYESFCKKHRKIISVWLAELTEKFRYPTSAKIALWRLSVSRSNSSRLSIYIAILVKSIPVLCQEQLLPLEGIFFDLSHCRVISK